MQSTVPTYLCPSVTKPPATTLFTPGHYAGNGGSQASPALRDGTLYPRSVTALQDITDGTSQTILADELAMVVGRSAHGSAVASGGEGGTGVDQGFSRAVVRWWRCNDTCARPGINSPTSSCMSSCEHRTQFFSMHRGGAHFVFADGHVAFLSENIDANLLRTLFTRSGGEAVGEY